METKPSAQLNQISPARDRPELDGFCESVNSANDRLASTVNRIQRLSERVYGTYPPEGADTKAAPQPSGVASFLCEQVGTLHAQLDKADQMLGRIEKFI